MISWTVIFIVLIILIIILGMTCPIENYENVNVTVNYDQYPYLWSNDYWKDGCYSPYCRSWVYGRGTPFIWNNPTRLTGYPYYGYYNWYAWNNYWWW